MNSIKIQAPAKVNLILNVLGKRKDGYHDLQTLFERIELADELEISRSGGGISVSSDRFITADPRDNLVYKAAELILESGKIGDYKGCRRVYKGEVYGGEGNRVGHKGEVYGGEGRKDDDIQGDRIKIKKRMPGVTIRIKKRIPIAAGLGGGSSDAAGVLMGVNKLYGLKMSGSALIKLGAKLGADVPFFLMDTPFAIGTGKGDKLRKIIRRAPALWHLLIYPGFKLATKEVYEAFDAVTRLTTMPRNVKIRRSLTRILDTGSPEDMLHNDLEDIAIAKKSVLGSIIERLASHLGRKAIVSGSGPSVFCLYSTRKEAMRARDRLFKHVLTPGERKKWQVFVTGTLY